MGSARTGPTASDDLYGCTVRCAGESLSDNLHDNLGSIIFLGPRSPLGRPFILPKGERGGIYIWICTLSSYPDSKLSVLSGLRVESVVWF